MTRRRLFLVLSLTALAIFLAILVWRLFGPRPGPGPETERTVQLFRPAPGAPPDFAAGGFQVISAASPDGARTAVLYPVEFEMPADLYLVTGPGEGTRLDLADSIRATLTPKNVGWIDPGRLWVVVGYLYGTVSPGGDLWAVDPGSGSARLLWASPDSGQTQAVAAEAPDGAGGAIAVRLKAFDENLITARDSTVTVGAGR
jgi:hypothetical protein